MFPQRSLGDFAFPADNFPGEQSLTLQDDTVVLGSLLPEIMPSATPTILSASRKLLFLQQRRGT